MPALNLAMNSLSSDALANVTKGHKIYPTKDKHCGANSIDSL